MNLWAVAVSAVVCVVFSAVFYGALASRMARWSSAYADASPQPWVLPVELVRALVVAAVVAWLVAGVTDSFLGALGLAAALWVAFPAVLLSGSVVHEKVPVPLAAIHAVDWLVKLVVIAVVTGVWA